MNEQGSDFVSQTCQMVCYTEPCGRALLETIWNRGRTFKMYFASDWIHHQFIITYHGCWSQLGKERKHCLHGENPSVPFFALLSMNKYSDITTLNSLGAAIIFTHKARIACSYRTLIGPNHCVQPQAWGREKILPCKKSFCNKELHNTNFTISVSLPSFWRLLDYCGFSGCLCLTSQLTHPLHLSVSLGACTAWSWLEFYDMEVHPPPKKFKCFQMSKGLG